MYYQTRKRVYEVPNMVLLKVTNVNSLKRVSTEAGCEKIQGMWQYFAEVYFRLMDCKDKEENLPCT